MPNVSFYRQTTGSTVEGAITFDTTNKKIYVGDGSTAHAFEGTDSKNSWVLLNSTTGIALNTFFSNSTYNKAQEIIIKFKTIPLNVLLCDCDETSTTTHEWVKLYRAPGTTITHFYCDAFFPTLSTYSRSSGIGRYYGGELHLKSNPGSSGTANNFEHNYVYTAHTNATTYTATAMGTQKCRHTTAEVQNYIMVMAVKY